MSLAGVGSNDNACGERNSDALHRAICQVTRAGVNLVAAAGPPPSASVCTPIAIQVDMLTF